MESRIMEGRIMEGRIMEGFYCTWLSVNYAVLSDYTVSSVWSCPEHWPPMDSQWGYPQYGNALNGPPVGVTSIW